MSREYTRRDFLKAMGIAAAGLAAAACRPLFGSFDTKDRLSSIGKLPQRAFGSTGRSVSLLGLGGQAAVESSHDRSLALNIINRAIDLGVNYIDTAPSYGGGQSEKNIGQVMRSRRSTVFLATKSNLRTYTAVRSGFFESLNNLQTDHVDLLQIHNIGTPEDVAALFALDGSGKSAIDAFAELRDEGHARFIGITGHHDPAQLLAVMNHARAPCFDAVLMALNPADRHTKPFQETLLPQAVGSGLAVVAMKVTGMTYLLREIQSMRDCLNYVFSLPISCALVGISNISQLEENVRITKDFSTALSQPEMQALEDLTTGTRPGGERKGDWFKIERY